MTSYSSACEPQPVQERQGEIAQATATLESAVLHTAALTTRLYGLTKRLGLAIPNAPAPHAELAGAPGQIYELREPIGRLERENTALAATVEALETL